MTEIGKYIKGAKLAHIAQKFASVNQALNIKIFHPLYFDLNNCVTIDILPREQTRANLANSPNLSEGQIFSAIT
jgi:hypothetical protein